MMVPIAGTLAAVYLNSYVNRVWRLVLPIDVPNGAFTLMGQGDILRVVQTERSLPCWLIPPCFRTTLPLP